MYSGRFTPALARTTLTRREATRGRQAGRLTLPPSLDVRAVFIIVPAPLQQLVCLTALSNQDLINMQLFGLKLSAPTSVLSSSSTLL
jgi:hypothetical protein